MEVEVVQQTKGEATSSSRFSARRLHLKNILAPTDFSQSSAKALTYGIAMARQFDATLWLLHIVEPAAPLTGLEGVPIAMDVQEQTSEAESKMAEFAAKHVPPDVSVSSVVRHGTAVREIADMAKAESIDLMIASTHHHNRLTRALFGGITERIIHHAPCPVLIVREREHDFVDGSVAERAGSIHMKRIVAPIDFTECSNKVLQYAMAFAGVFHAQVTCLHVVEPEQPLIVLELEGLQKTHEREARNNLQALLRQVDGGISVEATIATGAAHREIVHMADKRDADLIIIGEHCRTGVVGRFMLGSTADEVARNAHCPVLVVRRQQHEFIE